MGQQLCYALIVPRSTGEAIFGYIVVAPGVEVWTLSSHFAVRAYVGLIRARLCRIAVYYAIFISRFGLLQGLLIFGNRRLIIRLHLGKQLRLLIARRRLELLPDRLSIVHRLIAVREMWLHQLGSLDRLFLRLPRRFNVSL